MDVQMPVMDGFEATPRFEEGGRRRNPFADRGAYSARDEG